MANFDMATFLRCGTESPAAPETMSEQGSLASSVSRFMKDENFDDDRDFDVISRASKKALIKALFVAQRRSPDQVLTWRLFFKALQEKIDELMDVEGHMYDPSIVPRENRVLDDPVEIRTCLKLIADVLLHESLSRQSAEAHAMTPVQSSLAPAADPRVMVHDNPVKHLKAVSASLSEITGNNSSTSSRPDASVRYLDTLDYLSYLFTGAYPPHMRSDKSIKAHQLTAFEWKGFGLVKKHRIVAVVVAMSVVMLLSIILLGYMLYGSLCVGEARDMTKVRGAALVDALDVLLPSAHRNMVNVANASAHRAASLLRAVATQLQNNDIPTLLRETVESTLATFSLALPKLIDAEVQRVRGALATVLLASMNDATGLSLARVTQIVASTFPSDTVVVMRGNDFQRIGVGAATISDAAAYAMCFSQSVGTLTSAYSTRDCRGSEECGLARCTSSITCTRNVSSSVTYSVCQGIGSILFDASVRIDPQDARVCVIRVTPHGNVMALLAARAGQLVSNNDAKEIALGVALLNTQATVGNTTVVLPNQLAPLTLCVAAQQKALVKAVAQPYSADLASAVVSQVGEGACLGAATVVGTATLRADGSTGSVVGRVALVAVQNTSQQVRNRIRDLLTTLSRSDGRLAYALHNSTQPVSDRVLVVAGNRTQEVSLDSSWVPEFITRGLVFRQNGSGTSIDQNGVEVATAWRYIAPIDAVLSVQIPIAPLRGRLMPLVCQLIRKELNTYAAEVSRWGTVGPVCESVPSHPLAEYALLHRARSISTSTLR